MEKSKVLNLLRSGSIEVVGQFTWGSNYTFLIKVSQSGETIEAVYKPQRGERPLWDFPSETLAGREVAAFLVSEALGWDLVPPTVFRDDGLFGPGSIQLRVEHDPEQHYFTFDEATRRGLQHAALFDIIVNNADRKGGHVLLGHDGNVWLIDHGISFHAEPKLRTVIWDFAGQPTPVTALAAISKFAEQLYGDLNVALAAFLNAEERAALKQRTEQLLTEQRFPAPPESERVTPWPLV